MAESKVMGAGEELAEGAAGEGDVQDLYDTELSRYEAIVDRNLEESFERYGFTLFHSLPGLKQVELRQKLGFPVRDAFDSFNLASLAISREDYKGAMQLLEKAHKADPAMVDAIHNLALCCEKLDRKGDALKHWAEYADAVDDDAEKRAVEAHIAELKA
jgi:tetratricopeptide (TPR) repeat protein